MAEIREQLTTCTYGNPTLAKNSQESLVACLEEDQLSYACVESTESMFCSVASFEYLSGE